MDLASLAKAVRFALVGIVLVLSYFSIRSSFAIPKFEQIFKDMLNGKDLSPLTRWVIAAYPALLLFSFFVPLTAFGTLFSRRYAASIYLLGILLILIVVQLIIVSQGLIAPLTQILQTMQGTQGG